MKKIFYIICLLNYIFVQGQVKSNAGIDRTFCKTTKQGYYISPNDKSKDLSDTLGGNPSATNGKLPYSYVWTTLEDVVDVLPKEISAIKFIDSIYSPNPKLKNKPFKSKMFFLTVTDSNGIKSRDTIWIKISDLTLVKDCFTKKSKDTLNIYQQYWGSLPDFNYWESKTYLSSSIGHQVNTWNKTTDSVRAWAIDINGCRSDTNYIKILIDEGVSINQNKESSYILYHNPFNSNSIFTVNEINKIVRIEFYNLYGQKMTNIYPAKTIEVGELIKQKGIYIMCIQLFNGEQEIIKLTRE
jgi:hypothetical protein